MQFIFCQKFIREFADAETWEWALGRVYGELAGAINRENAAL